VRGGGSSIEAAAAVVAIPLIYSHHCLSPPSLLVLCLCLLSPLALAASCQLTLTCTHFCWSLSGLPSFIGAPPTLTHKCLPSLVHHLPLHVSAHPCTYSQPLVLLLCCCCSCCYLSCHCCLFHCLHSSALVCSCWPLFVQCLPLFTCRPHPCLRTPFFVLYLYSHYWLTGFSIS
jgi:hypothetical protein